MPSHDRRSAGRRRAWGRGPIILKFESLEKRELLSSGRANLPDLVASSFVTPANADWNDTLAASGQITNQGRGMVTRPFNVGIYASHNGNMGPYAVLIGQVAIPAGLAPGQSVPFSTTVKLPASPVPKVSTNGVVYIDLKVDPERGIRELNKRNNSGIGLGRDSSAVQISPMQPSRLVSTAVGVYPAAPQWGGALSVTAQISNKSYGNAPATRAQVVLTPAGATPGGPYDVTIGSIPVPAIAPWSMVNVEESIALPATPPVLLAGATQFTLSLLPDADFITNPVYPHVPTGGLGLDQAGVSITIPENTTPPPLGLLPDLAAGSVTVSPANLVWGHSFQVQTRMENLGEVDPGPFRVRFVLVGASGYTGQGLVLGDATVDGLGAGKSQILTETLRLPPRLPADVTLSSVGVGRIAVILDPESTLNETFKNNNMATSGPVNLRVLGADGTTAVPNLPAPGQLLAVNANSVTTADAQAGTPKVAVPPQRKLYRKPPKKDNSFLHNLSVFPRRVNELIRKYI